MTLGELNQLKHTEAQAELLKCCGSTRWAREMSRARPFASLEELCEKADAVCESLNEEDWLEAFRAHPKIGGGEGATEHPQQARSWSSQGQTGGAEAAGGAGKRPGRKKPDYQAPCGLFFIVCSTGESTREML